MTKPYESGYIHRFNDFYICGPLTEIDYSRMIKITKDKARKEILHILSISPRALGLKFSTWSLRCSRRLCKGKEDSKRRWDKPYYCKRYTKKKWNRVEAFKDCS